MLERRLHLVVQPQSHEEKCCFCPGRGCRPLSSQGYLRVSGSTTMCFMDLGKVFKNVSLNSVGGVSEVSPLWILYQSIILNKCQTSPLFCFLTSSANSIVIAIVNIQTGSIDWNVRCSCRLPKKHFGCWEGVYVFPLCVFRLTAVRSSPLLLSAVFNPALAANRPDTLKQIGKEKGGKRNNG